MITINIVSPVAHWANKADHLDIEASEAAYREAIIEVVKDSFNREAVVVLHPSTESFDEVVVLDGADSELDAAQVDEVIFEGVDQDACLIRLPAEVHKIR